MTDPEARLQPRGAICPLCKGVVGYSLDGRIPGAVYMDGWHHKTCLDAYMQGGQALEDPTGRQDDFDTKDWKAEFLALQKVHARTRGQVRKMQQTLTLKDQIIKVREWERDTTRAEGARAATEHIRPIIERLVDQLDERGPCVNTTREIINDCELCFALEDARAFLEGELESKGTE